jgi:NADH-quinone oxidoreductase subunit N
LILDNISVIFSSLFILGAILTIALSLNSHELESARFVDYLTLIVGATFCACIVASSNNLITFFFALEAFSLCLYALVASNKNSKLSSEAALKYTLYGIFCSSVMLYGLSLLYGYSNSLVLDYATKFVFTSKDEELFTIIALLISAGLAFKICLVPFHFWGPDVYQGGASPIVAFISTVSKACGFAACVRLYTPVFKYLITYPQEYLPLFVIAIGLLALISMTYANLIALKQNDIKRLFAYSSIANAGYILLALCLINDNCLKALIFFLTVFILANFGVFWCIIKLINNANSANISDWRGLGQKFPYLSALFFIFIISLIGLPPTAGFSAKFFIFQNLVTEGLGELKYNLQYGLYNAIFYFTLVVVGLMNSIISAGYYLRIISVLCFEKAGLQQARQPNRLLVSKLDYCLPSLLVIVIIYLVGFEPLFSLLNV